MCNGIVEKSLNERGKKAAEKKSCTKADAHFRHFSLQEERFCSSISHETTVPIVSVILSAFQSTQLQIDFISSNRLNH